jgi:UDP-N-acetylglucosamine--N-acetylmuramyl-(pentapeptide) pyrophosphoryl-undecaprenol N-acetylglucosamine transferase
MAALKPILIMAGGTGGHVFPGLAVACYLRQRGFPLLWLGTRRGLEARLVPQAGLPLVTISVQGIRGKGLKNYLLAPWQLLRALAQALRVLARSRPAVVLGLGGFVTGPGGVAAWVMRIPLLVHEQNAIPGTTNRLLARIATRVLEAFPHTFSGKREAICTGNPVRAALCQLPPPQVRLLTDREQRIRVLVLGGSQGAHTLNRIVPQALALLEGEKLAIRHQSGVADQKGTEESYREYRLDAEVRSFFEDMQQVYAWADLAICRAGALTLSELTVAGIGAILVPFPHAVDDHQSANARHLAAAGAAIVVPEHDLSADRLAQLLGDLFAERARLITMAERARSLARPDATQAVAEQCMELTHG